MEGVNTPRRIFLSPSKLGFGSQEFSSRKFSFKRVEIIARLNFLSSIKIQAVDSGFQVLDSSLGKWNLDSGFLSLVGIRIP